MAEEYNYDEYNRLCGEQARLEEKAIIMSSAFPSLKVILSS